MYFRQLLPKPRGAEVYDWNVSEMKYQGSAEGTTAAPGTEWSENGNHILQAHGNKTLTVFYFLHNCWVVGNLRATKRDKCVDLCAAIIYNVSLCAFLFFINI